MLHYRGGGRAFAQVRALGFGLASLVRGKGLPIGNRRSKQTALLLVCPRPGWLAAGSAITFDADPKKIK